MVRRPPPLEIAKCALTYSRIVYIDMILAGAAIIAINSSSVAARALQRGTLGYFDLSSLAFCYAYDEGMTIRVQDRAWTTSLVVYIPPGRVSSRKQTKRQHHQVHRCLICVFLRDSIGLGFDSFLLCRWIQRARPEANAERCSSPPPPPQGRLCCCSAGGVGGAIRRYRGPPQHAASCVAH